MTGGSDTSSWLRKPSLSAVSIGVDVLVLSLAWLIVRQSPPEGWTLSLIVLVPRLIHRFVNITVAQAWDIGAGITLIIFSWAGVEPASFLQPTGLYLLLRWLVLTRFSSYGSASAKVRRALRRRQENPGIYQARFADLADLHERNMLVRVHDWTPKIFLGAVDAETFAIGQGFAGRRELGHFLITGATRAGKGRHLVANTLVWPSSLIVLDIKGENYAETAGFRESWNRVAALHPSGLGQRFDPFLELQYSDEALRSAAEIIIDPGRDKQPAFGETAVNALYAGLLGAAIEQKSTVPYLDKLLSLGIVGFLNHLTSLRDDKVNAALTRFLGVPPADFRIEMFERPGLVSGAWRLLNARCSSLFTDGITAMMGGSDFQAKDFYEENFSLYLIFPETEAAGTSKAFRLVLMGLLIGMMRTYDQSSVAPEHPVLFLLDEAGRTPIPKLDEFVATSAGRNITLGIYIQDLPQLETLYGRAGAKTVLSNIRTQCFYAPTDDLTAKYIETRLGTTTAKWEIYYEDLWDFQGQIRNERHRPLMAVSELLQMPLDHFIIFCAATPPIYAYRLDPSYFGIETEDPPPLKALPAPKTTLHTAPRKPRVDSRIADPDF